MIKDITNKRGKAEVRCRKGSKNGKENLTEWFGVVYGEEVHEMAQ